MARDTINNTKKIKKIIFAIWLAATAIPLKPRIPATIAITKNMTTHCNIMNPIV